ncbi:MAG: hypothetical protein LBM00_11330 [Deltaproteobacteria bacterium]|jgi:hypothetical protein|nr:hypothetical protein [Deltaproteobacteria bacterium]
MKRLAMFMCITGLLLAGCGGGGGSGGGGALTGYGGLSGGTKGASINLPAYDNLPAVQGPASPVSGNIEITSVEGPSSGGTITGASYKVTYSDGSTASLSITDDGLKMVRSGQKEEGLTIPGRNVELVHFKTLDGNASYQKLWEIFGIAGPSPSLHGAYNVSSEVTVDKISQNVQGVNVDGTLTSLDMVMLGGEELQLSYTDFGGWLTYQYFEGKIGGSSESAYIWETDAFAYGDASHKAHFVSGSGEKTFNGNVIGGVGNYDNSVYRTVFGDASLTVDLANLGNTRMVLDFKDFYKFDVTGLAIDNSGHLGKGTGSTVTAAAADNKTGLSFNNPNIERVNGQFYGSSATDPSEATGTFRIRSGSNTVGGAFGVK